MSRRQDGLDAALEDFRDEGITCTASVGDVRDPGAAKNALDHAVSKLGRLDIVVNNAAGDFPAPLSRISPKGFKTVVDIDLFGTCDVWRIAFDAWLKEHGGNIVNISAPFDGKGAGIQPRKVGWASRWSHASP